PISSRRRSNSAASSEEDGDGTEWETTLSSARWALDWAVLNHSMMTSLIEYHVSSVSHQSHSKMLSLTLMQYGALK
ncbi:hypothetical protein Taro_043033, partial [Colocasia esculenta]|nr:hypothetical protein [Colocasia esculenta]